MHNLGGVELMGLYVGIYQSEPSEIWGPSKGNLIMYEFCAPHLVLFNCNPIQWFCHCFPLMLA